MYDPDPNIPSPNSNSTVTNLPSADQIAFLNLPISTKLSRTNFLAWKSQIVLALHDHGLYRYLEEAPPPANITVEGQNQINPSCS